MRNPVAKHFRKFCKPSIQQSKRRQALMLATLQDEEESLFIPQYSLQSLGIEGEINVEGDEE